MDAMAVVPEWWRGAGVWRTSMSSSPRSESSVCCSLSPSVTPQSAVATHSPLMHLSILAICGTTLPHILSSSNRKHVILLSSHSAKKALSSSGTSTLPLPIDLLNPPLHSSTYLSACLASRLAICLQSLPLACTLNEDLLIAFDISQYVVCLSVYYINYK